MSFDKRHVPLMHLMQNIRWDISASNVIIGLDVLISILVKG
jgi:hypothetical protein